MAEAAARRAEAAEREAQELREEADVMNEALRVRCSKIYSQKICTLQQSDVWDAAMWDHRGEMHAVLAEPTGCVSRAACSCLEHSMLLFWSPEDDRQQC